MTIMHKNKATAVFAFFGVLLMLDTIIVYILKGGPNLGTFFPGIIGACILILLMLQKTDLYDRNKKFLIKIERLVIAFFLIWVMTFIIASGLIIVYSLPDRSQEVDCVLVLGAGLRGEEPSVVLKERLNLSLEYINQNPDVKIIVTGGKGIGEDITEAEAMKKYLVARGVKEVNILKEERSTSTIENLKFSKLVFEENYNHELKRIMIITSDFHMFRAKFLASRAGIKAYGISSNTPFYIYPNVFIREYFAIIKSFVLDKA